MHWVVSPGAVILFATAGLALMLAGLAWGRSSRGEGWLLPFLMLAIAEWCLAAGLEASAVALPWKLVWSKFEYAGNSSTATLFLLFAARHTGRARWLRGPWRRLLWLLPAVALGLATTNELHGLIWSGFTPGPAGSNTIVYHHGLGFFVVVAWIYAYILFAVGLFASSVARPAARPRREAITILIAAAFPTIAGVLYMVDVWPAPWLNLVPISFALTAVVFLLGMGFFRLFDIVPIARDALVEQMTDAVLVADTEGRIVDANPAACAWLDSPSLVGRNVADALSSWPELRYASAHAAQRLREMTLREEPLLHVDVRMAPIIESRERSAGTLIVMRDITARYRARLSLERANERLAAQLTQIEALQGELRERAIRDSLTGLFNRRYLDEVLPRELARAAHDGSTVSVVMIDIDHFKDTNDLRGHREGDRLLAILGTVLREGTRPGDAACRYGGEEFLLVLPGASPDAAKARMDSLRAEYATRLRAEGFAAPPTLSAGVAAFPQNARTDDELLRAADAALYAAKAAGRDRVVIADSAGD